MKYINGYSKTFLYFDDDFLSRRVLFLKQKKILLEEFYLKMKKNRDKTQELHSYIFEMGEQKIKCR